MFTQSANKNISAFLRCILVSCLINYTSLFAQETNSHASGKVFDDKNEGLAGASVVVIHEPTQSKYVAVTRSDGSFYFFNLKPGGPYTIIITSTGFKNLKTDNLYIHFKNEHFSLGNTEATEFILEQHRFTLDEVVVKTQGSNTNKSGIETSIKNSALQSLPTISRSFQDFLRVIPQAKVTGDGVISLAGQNNRFNAFFIDGGNTNDILGLAVNGTNGGQTGTPPISIEAIEEIKVLLAPYNVEFGNFTGGSINAITRSGSNTNKSSVWYYFRDESLAGRSPKPIENPSAPGEFYRPRLSDFFNQTFGAWNSGAIIKNKLFYFALIEKQDEEKPQPYNISEYRGNGNQQQLLALSDFLKTKYQYDPGSFLETKDALNATRVVLKMDWEASIKNKFMLSYRYNDAQRNSPRVQSSASSISFENNGIKVPSKTHSASFEWKRFFKRDFNNRLLITFTNQSEGRKWMGQPFPLVSILDGTGSTGIFFGSDNVSGAQGFKANDITLFNALKFIKENHQVTLGLDINYASLKHTAIPAYFGSYTYRNLNDFLNSAYPSRLQRTYPFDNQPITSDYAMSKFSTFRFSTFLNDEIKINTDFKINMGVRVDVNSFFSKQQADQFFNDTAAQIISKYYDLKGALSGEGMKTHFGLSPRMGLEYKLPKYNTTLRGGAGLFVGHSINLWASNVSSSMLNSIDINPQQYGLYFNPDPYKQPTAQSLNINAANSKGDLHLVSKDFKYPTVFRTSISIEKKVEKTWTFSIEGILTKNIYEAAFRSVNLLPPVGKTSSPDTRNVYSLNSTPGKIPLRANGSNPYNQVFLLTNNNEKRGSAYSLSFIVNKQLRDFSFNSSYTYGSSKVLFEITGPTTPIRAQWVNNETVNGKNFINLSTSDNELRHRISTWVSKKISYAKSKGSTNLSIFYNGQSGSPYSYVYNGSIVNDNGNREAFDLIYIPTVQDLASMNFSSNNTHSSQQQKDLLNTFIEGDKYLRKHRGEFAQRNGDRLPFTHIVDLRIQQDFIIKIKTKNVGLSVSYDVFNFTNMLNKDWGAVYFLGNDKFPLIEFVGYANTTTLTPQYQYKPVNGKPYTLQSSTTPGNSARWLSQLGFKVNL